MGGSRPRPNWGSHHGRYILIGKLAVPERDLLKWATWLEKNINKRHVGDTKIGPVRISTVFLGLDHNFFGDGLPILFETMIFRGGDGDETWRYETWQEAEAGHKKAVDLVRAEILAKAKEKL
jgi:hypothetical protein